MSYLTWQLTIQVRDISSHTHKTFQHCELQKKWLQLCSCMVEVALMFCNVTFLSTAQ